jgi:nuclear pore complex protein Nup205
MLWKDKAVDSLPQVTRRVLGVALENLVSGGTFVDRCISTMATIRESVQQLRDKEKHAQTLRMAMDVGAKDDLVLQLESLWMQHEMLASILSYLVKDRRASVADFRRLLGVFKGFERYDVFVAHVALPTFTFISFACGPESPLSFEETIQLHGEILKDYKENPWNLRYCQAGFLIWWLSEFNGLCNDPPLGNAPSKDTLDYFTDVHDPAKVALKDGGLELIMAMASDIGLESPLNSAKEDLHRFLQTRVSPLEDVGLLTERVQNAAYWAVRIIHRYIHCQYGHLAAGY